MKTNLKKLLSLCLAGIVTAGMAISASAIGVYKVTTNNEIAGNDAKFSIDLDDSRLWHTDWINGPFEPPFILTYELDAVHEIKSIGLYPRQDGNLNGLPYVLNINVSDDGVNFTTVEEVDWLEYTYDLQTIELRKPVTTKFLQLEILDTEGYEFASLNQLYITEEAVTFSEKALAEKQAEIDAMLAANGFKSIVADNDHPDYLAIYAGDG
ncbi:MAG: discoidin domain-containing protein, partial [Clostridia bacterium]|nr:discoidin domain-containing protein [Clostridia bacterium]